MSAPIVPHPAAGPEAVWPGFATIDPIGARIARDMLDELECVDMDEHGTSPAEYCQLDDWPRQGRPFRNIVAEYTAKAQAVSPEALAAFYAVLSDFLATACQGCVPTSDGYDRYCAEEGPR